MKLRGLETKSWCVGMLQPTKMKTGGGREEEEEKPEQAVKAWKRPRCRQTVMTKTC